MLVIVLLSLIIWLGLIFFHHGFWRCDQLLPDVAEGQSQAPDVVAIVPARNEAETIEACAQSILSQDYSGSLHLIIVNDNSEDETEALARAAIEASERTGEVMNGAALQKGWSGKLWALSQGVAKAGDKAPYLWFSDADIEHGPQVLAKLVAHAERGERGLVSLMVGLRAKTFFEKLVVPAFVFFFQKLYPFPAVNNPASRFGGAAGGCVLLKRQALEDIGGIAAIKDRLIDDCALGAAVKRAGYPIWLGHGRESYSLRGYDDFSSLSQMVTRTAFAQLGYSNVLLLGTVIGMTLIYLVPPLMVFTGLFLGLESVALIAALAWFLMMFAYRPTVKLYDLSGLWAIFLPFTAVLFEFFTLKSAWAHWRGGHTGWKGRDYASSGDKLEL